MANSLQPKTWRDENIGHLAKFLADVSTEQRRAKHAALDGASP
jgi:hypothetical protein